MRNKILLIFFLLDTFIHLVLIPLKDTKSKKIGIYITKPLLMPLLALYYALNNQNINGLILGGILLGWVGDVTLMWPKNEKCFIVGLGSFLLGHILYIITFFKIAGDLSYFKPINYLVLIAYGAFFIGMLRYLKGSLGEMKIPVILYMTLILVMSFASFVLLFLPESTITNILTYKWLPFLGSLLFIASDSLLANQLFKKPFKNDQVLIMITYIFAQFCIAQAYMI